MSTTPPYLLSDDGQRLVLKDPTSLGRTPGNDLVVADPGCSGRHALVWCEEGHWIIEDLGSTNGTWINGERLEERRELREDDLLRLGHISFRVRGLELRACRRCGAEAPGEARFCPACGQALGESGPTGTMVLPRPSANPPAPAPPPEPAAAPVAPVQAPSPRRTGLWIALLAVALVVAALTAGVLWVFTRRKIGAAPPPAPAPSQKELLPPKLGLFHEALLFRQEASGRALQAAVERRAAGKALDFLRSSAVYREAPAAWAYFFSGTVVLGGYLESPRPVVAYYNPYLDGVLLTQWELKEGTARIVAADLRIASAMAGQAPRDPKVAWWIGELARRPLPVVLKEQYGAFLRAFATAYPVASREEVALEQGRSAAQVLPTLEKQALASLSNLVQLQSPKSPVYSPQLAALQRALRSGNAPALARLMPARNPMTPEALVAQPAWVRGEAVPIYAMEGRERTIVLLSPSRAPRYYLQVAWTRKDAAHMEVVAPYDMDGSALPILRNVPQGGKP